MESRKVYIQAAEQISIQTPLSEEWMNAPISYEEPLVKAVNPSFRVVFFSSFLHVFFSLTNIY